MPKASPNQTSFSGGEFSPLVQGRVDVEKYKTGVLTCINYFPTLQGPLMRRPGTKYIGDVKDPSNPPTLIPFQFSSDQSYMLEFGNQYIRFWANEGQVVTNTTVFKVTGTDNYWTLFGFTGARGSPSPNPGEVITATSVIASGSVFEIVSPYTVNTSTGIDHPKDVRYAQKDDVLYLAHPSIGTYKLQRRGSFDWQIGRVAFKDGPYLPVNSYRTTGDQLRTTVTPAALVGGTITTGPVATISGAAAYATSLIQITATSHGFQSGDQVVILNVVGTTEANNDTSTIPKMQWPIQVIDANTFVLIGSQFTNAYISGGTAAPALFDPNPLVPGFLDVGRQIAIVGNDQKRHWGYILTVTNRRQASIILDNGSILAATSVISTWQMGVWRRGVLAPYENPSVVCFHQDRLSLGGTPYVPQELDLSMTANYETFSASASTYTVADNHAISIRLLSSESNPIRWVKSSNQGLLAGAASVEWQVAPNNQNGALTPTNVNASPTSYFGSANVDAVQAANATLYVQTAYRKIRELNYFFQVGTFRSTDLTELSEHITAPTVTKLAVQKEPVPLVWAVRSDGWLVSMSYNRDDTTLKAGWARHYLGGQSDSGGTVPQVKSIGVISASSATFDQLWMTVKRFINGTSVLSVEAITTPYNDSLPQEDAYCLDMGATFDSPKLITNVTVAGSAVVTCASHGFNNGSSIIVTDVVGLNFSATTIDGVIVNSNFINEKTFIVASTTANTFYLQNFQGGFISASSYSPYISGGRARKLVTQISGLTWLKNETVGIVADGSIHPSVVVNSAGLIALSYPAAKVQIGYRYNSDGARLRAEAGSATGSSIGMLRRITRAAFLLHAVGDFSFGPNFQRLIPCEFQSSDDQLADNATPLFSGLTRDGIEMGYEFDDQLVWRQNSGLPGLVQSVATMMDETDV